MKEVIVIGGANGTGKTTFAKSLIQERGLIFLNADEIAASLADQPQPNLKAGRIFLKKLDELAASGENFILESTLAGRYLEAVFLKLKAAGYRLNLIYLFLENANDSIQRIQIRVRDGGHFIPDEDVIRRFFRSRQNFWNFYRFQVDEWHLFFNADQVFEEVAIGLSDDFTIENEPLLELFLKEMTDES